MVAARARRAAALHAQGGAALGGDGGLREALRSSRAPPGSAPSAPGRRAVIRRRKLLLRINNRPIFCGGANWIPADVLPTRVSKERYARLLDEAGRGELTMLRVWGGGIYETDAFYDLCDERGLLIWQDFGFACGLYPALPEFQSVAREATSAVKRLRHHPPPGHLGGQQRGTTRSRSRSGLCRSQRAHPAPGPSSLAAPLRWPRALRRGCCRRCARRTIPAGRTGAAVRTRAITSIPARPAKATATSGTSGTARCATTKTTAR